VGTPLPDGSSRHAILSGIIRLRQGVSNAAQQAFSDAIAHAEEQLRYTPKNFHALDTKAIALAGLTLTGPTDYTADAAHAFAAARAITDAPGITTRVLHRLATLTPADPTGALHSLRISSSCE
jgi:hypothetical protein